MFSVTWEMNFCTLGIKLVAFQLSDFGMSSLMTKFPQYLTNVCYSGVSVEVFVFCEMGVSGKQERIGETVVAF